MDCESAVFTESSVNNAPMQRDFKQSTNKHKLYKKLDGEYFIDNAATKFQLRHLNIVNVADIDIILVSVFEDLLGLPFITRNESFKGTILMTQPLYQIGQIMLLEFVSLNNKRNLTKD